jgi:phosphohistidine phosphatase
MVKRATPKKCLTLLRHGKSSWREPDLNDLDRPLNNRGQRDAPMMAQRLAERGFQPDLLLVSSALRARLTVEALTGLIPVDPGLVTFDERIYLATVDGLVDLVRTLPEDCRNVLLVGHNPGMTDLANFLVGCSLENIPTCGVFSVELQVPSWREIDREGAKLVFYDYPKKSSEEKTAGEGGDDMGCLKGKSKTKPKPGAYICEKCDAASKKKDDLCKGKKIKDKEKDKKKK